MLTQPRREYVLNHGGKMIEEKDGLHWDPEVPHFGHFFCPGGHFSKGVGLGTFFLPNLGKKNPVGRTRFFKIVPFSEHNPSSNLVFS